MFFCLRIQFLMTCPKKIFPSKGPHVRPNGTHHWARCWMFSLKTSSFSKFPLKSTAHRSMLKPSAHVFHEMSICLRSYIGSGACDGAGTHIDCPTGGCCGVNRRYAYWLYDVGPPAMLPRNSGEGTEMDSSSHTCLFDGTQNMEQTDSKKTMFPSTSQADIRRGQQTLKLHRSSSQVLRWWMEDDI